MEPEDWGPFFWRTLHTVSFYYPDSPSEAEMEACFNFYTSLVYLLPCDECCGHFNELLKEMPIEPALVGRQELSQWVYDLHTKVNQSLGKTTQPTYQQVKADILKLQPKYAVSHLAKEHQEKIALSSELMNKQARLQNLRSRSAEPPRIGGKNPNFLANNKPGQRQISNPGVGGKKPCKDCAKKRLARGH